MDRGILKSGTSGGESLNPFNSGTVHLEVSPFFRSITIESDDIADTEIKTNGVDLSLRVDNRDYPANPSKGYSLSFKASRDFGEFESSKSWTAYQFESDIYIGLGSNGWLRQSVIAFDFWAAHSPTWEVSGTGKLEHNPPPFAGASLGGHWRMRGYPTQRFNDKAAIYYSLELRLIPEWNPFESWSWLQRRLGVQWIQFVPFVEFGRVASDWDMTELHEDMKWDAGLGLRFNAKGMVLRIDTAVSEEDYWIQMMVAQPFQF
jgi:outer membrane protein assembly factor BamA